MRLVSAVFKALKILELVNVKQRNVTELSDMTGIPRGTVHRILRTLEEAGYLYCEERKGINTFYVNQAVKRLSSGATDYFEEYYVIKPLLYDLARDIEWPIYLAVNDGFHMDVITSTEDISPFYLKDSILGARLPLFKSASGIAFLAACDSDVRKTLLLKMDHFIDDPRDRKWAKEQLMIAMTSSRVVMENCDWQNYDRPISSLSIGLNNAERAIGAITMRYYSSAYITDDVLDSWTNKLIAFREEFINKLRSRSGIAQDRECELAVAQLT